MILRGKTSEQWKHENRIHVERWRQKDAPQIAAIEKQWLSELQWHRWFAWYPVEIGDGETAWLQTVERKLRFSDKPTIMASWYIRAHIYRRMP